MLEPDETLFGMYRNDRGVTVADVASGRDGERA